MSWTYHHDPVGVPDYPKEFWNLPFPSKIMDYWTNDDGVRIGFFGDAKGIGVFTYKSDALNVRFDVIRAPGQGPEIIPKGDLYSRSNMYTYTLKKLARPISVVPTGSMAKN